MLNNRWLGEEQHRVRRFSFGSLHDVLRLPVQTVALENPLFTQAVTADQRAVPVKMAPGGKVKGTWRPPTVTAGHSTPFDRPRQTIADMCELQGLPRDFLEEAPFTAHGKRKVIGNGVPLPMGRAIAKAVRRALEEQAAVLHKTTLPPSVKRSLQPGGGQE